MNLSRILRATFLVPSVCLALAVPAFAQKTAPAPAPSAQNAQDESAIAKMVASWGPNTVIPLDTTIHHGVLANGLTYYVRHNGTPAKRAELRLGIKVGSVQEGESQQGMSHFIVHMAFDGTTNFQKSDLSDFLQSVGMRYGPDVSAYAGFDQTVYELQIPVSDPRLIQVALLVLRDWAQGITFDKSAVEQERAAIEKEISQGWSADSRMQDAQVPEIYKGSRYAERLPLGKADQVAKFTRDELVKFYKEWYRPNLMSVVVVGDIDASSVEQMVKQYFGGLKNPPNEVPHRSFTVPDHQATYVAEATDPEASLSTVSVYYMRDVVPELTVANYRTLIIQRLFSDMLSRRFQQIAGKANPDILYGVAGYNAPIRAKAQYYLTAVVPSGGDRKGLTTLLTEAARVREHGFTQDELDTAKLETQSFIQSLNDQRNNSNSGEFADEYLRNFFEAEFTPGIAAEYELHERLLPEITLSEVNARAKQWLAETNRVILLNGPESAKASMLSEQEVASVVAATQSAEVNSYVGQGPVQPLMKSKPAGGSIVSEKKDEKNGIYEWSLSNGVRVVVKPTDFRKDQVLFSSFSPGGTSLASDSDYIPASTAVSIVTQSGVGDFSAAQLGTQLAGHDVTVNPYIDSLTQGFTGSSSPRDLETMLQLIYLYATSPRRSEDAFQSYVTRLKGFIANQHSQPDQVFSDELQTVLANGNERGMPFSLDSIEKMNLDASMKFYKARFANFSNAVFVFTGAIDLNTFKPLVATYLGALPSTGASETWRNVTTGYPKGVIKKVVHSGMGTTASVELVFPGTYTWSVKNNYLLDSLALVINMRLLDILQPELGGDNDVSVWASTARYPTPTYAINVSFSCDASKLDSLVEKTLAQIEWMSIFVEDEYVKRAVEAQANSHQANLTSNKWWLGQIRDAYFNDLPVGGVDFASLQALVTGANLEKAIRDYIDFDNYIEVELLPEQK